MIQYFQTMTLRPAWRKNRGVQAQKYNANMGETCACLSLATTWSGIKTDGNWIYQPLNHKKTDNFLGKISNIALKLVRFLELKADSSGTFTYFFMFFFLSRQEDEICVWYLGFFFLRSLFFWNILVFLMSFILFLNFIAWFKKNNRP